MKISEDRKKKLFADIFEPIMDKRVQATRAPLTESDLYMLDIEIWERVKKTLNIDSDHPLQRRRE